MATDDEKWLRQAIAASNDAVDIGSAPFAGLVVQDGKAVGAGLNRVRQDFDPTADAEVVATHTAYTGVHHSKARGNSFASIDLFDDDRQARTPVAGW